MASHLLTIGRLASAAGVGVETVRYYQQRELLPIPAASGAFRQYPSDLVNRIRFVKRAQELGFSLAEINELLVRLARPGRTVVRLKGGDPFIFGRGCEEAIHLAAHAIPFEVVPGITAASGCAAAALIPLTHRGYASGVRFLTGHCCAGSELALNWQSLADPDTTLVVYMGLANLPEICLRLIAHGLPTDLPAALIEKGTTAEQRVITATLASLAEEVRRHDVSAPTLIIIGNVVQLRRELNWYRGGAVEPARSA